MKHLFPFILILILLSGCSKDRHFAIDTEQPIEVSACRAIFKATGKNGSSKKITEKGFCYSSAGTPVYGDNNTPSTNGFVDLFEAEMRGLLPNTKYYVRAYTKLKSAAIVYGDVEEFYTNGVYMPGDTGPSGGIIYATNAAASTGKYSEALVIGGGQWGCSGNELGNISMIGSGLNNSIAIASSCGITSAAAFCINLTHNNTSDWYLPSIAELSLLYSFVQSNSAAIPKKHYWSSSQWDATQAFSIDFAGSSSWLHTAKTFNNRIIAVRNFD